MPNKDNPPPRKSTKTRAAAKKPARAGKKKGVDMDAFRRRVSQELAGQAPSASLTATTTYEVPSAHQGAFLSALDALADAARHDEDNGSFSFHKRKGSGDDVEYLTYENWSSGGSFADHWNAAATQAFHGEVESLLEREPEMHFFYGADDVGALAIPKTGLKRCWDTAGNEVPCGGTGQDADVDAGAPWPSPRFRDNGDGTVTDLLTDLVWLQDADRFGEVTWQQALDKSKFLQSGDDDLSDGSRRGDWRLPNIRELRSLLDYSQVAPMIPPDHAFDNVQSAIYWTSTSLAAAPKMAWMTTTGIGPAVFVFKTSAARMWPVRGRGRVAKTGQVHCWDSGGNPLTVCSGTGQDGELQAGVASPPERFVANGDGTVLDKLTGLVWLESGNPFGWCDWQESLDLCNALCHGRHGLSDRSRAGDWRLPNVLEMESLIDYGQPAPSLPPGHPFKAVQPTSYWTSTTVSSAPTQAMFSILGVGPSIFENKEHPFLVWPVRDAR